VLLLEDLLAGAADIDDVLDRLSRGALL